MSHICGFDSKVDKLGLFSFYGILSDDACAYRHQTEKDRGRIKLLSASLKRYSAS